MKKIQLRAMSETEYEVWRRQSLANYIEQKEKSGLTTEAAKRAGDSSFARLLPQKLASPNQYLYSILEDSQVIGTLWWGLAEEDGQKNPWVYDIVIDPAVRGRGYGREAMLLAEEEVKKKGFTRLGLHVFGHNEVARKLYETLGFRSTNIVMRKDF